MNSHVMPEKRLRVFLARELLQLIPFMSDVAYDVRIANSLWYLGEFAIVGHCDIELGGNALSRVHNRYGDDRQV